LREDSDALELVATRTWKEAIVSGSEPIGQLEEPMRSALIVIVIFLAVFTFGQQDSGVPAAACGPKSTRFNVKVDESQHMLAEPEPGKALVYFVQDVG
jgi:hypothetical protein